MEFHHIGIAVGNMEEALRALHQQYLVKEASDIIHDENQNADLCMVTLEDGFKIELVSGDVVKGWLKRGQALYHVCYEVDHLDVELNERCQFAGNVLVSQPKEAPLFHNRRVAFIKTWFGLIELLER